MTTLFNLSIFLIITFKLTLAYAPEHRDLWVVWNVGQGQWVTHIQSFECWHFDVGGEFGSFSRIRRQLISQCGQKTNRVFLSHWDADHILNIPQLVRHIPKVCWQSRPQAFAEKVLAQKILQLKIPPCDNLKFKMAWWAPVFSKNSNQSSQIFLDQNVLLTGDSPVDQEKVWSQKILTIAGTQILVLGHHGSRTSTSLALLSRLPRLKLSIASARYAKYHHPHQQTKQRLSFFRIPMLSTEDWGNIWFKITP